MISRRTLVLAMLFAPAAGAAQSPIGEHVTTFDERFKGDRDVVEPCELRNACPVEPEIPTPAPRPKKAKKAERKRKRSHDICRGRGRTYTKNGKSWRCNRS